ncbi:TetR family transcriptional regulator [Williamsia sterculiae]|uniref:Transcriptional regulator, TetR family n=1 Tax=Williamsia sterculiae TaxID=1344003 RepID=A0A1N7H6K4_9NOCA|nr:TetR family transcriptional regulator [Williamsia sterculiae]SIS20298.1 transcriptional regulator, TetR family [Williamsia sterculiae]
MPNSRDDVLDAARAILDRYSLADLSMRRLAGELGVRPNALYWHFPNKQSLLAALADRILDDVVSPPATDPWDTQVIALVSEMRRVLLAVTDSAELVSASWASGLSAMTVAGEITTAVSRGGLGVRDARAVTTAACQLVIGLTFEQQTRAQMERLGVSGPSGRDFDEEFADGLAVVVDGARERSGERARRSA